jgi:hypothetical protein
MVRLSNGWTEVVSLQTIGTQALETTPFSAPMERFPRMAWLHRSDCKNYVNTKIRSPFCESKRGIFSAKRLFLENEKRVLRPVEFGVIGVIIFRVHFILCDTEGVSEFTVSNRTDEVYLFQKIRQCSVYNDEIMHEILTVIHCNDIMDISFLE